MTHPDIIKMERFGTLDPRSIPKLAGFCAECGTELWDNSPELVKSVDGLFCDIECCHEYYQIKTL